MGSSPAPRWPTCSENRRKYVPVAFVKDVLSLTIFGTGRPVRRLATKLQAASLRVGASSCDDSEVRQRAVDPRERLRLAAEVHGVVDRGRHGGAGDRHAQRLRDLAEAFAER